MIPAWAGGLILALAALLVFGPVSHDAEMRLINQRVGENSQFLTRQISANLLSVITHNERSVNQ